MPNFHFPTLFASLNNGYAPFPWQHRLFDEFVNGNIPNSIDLPTGTGKTSVLTIWLLALIARTRQNATSHFPRRLIWAVDRRVVVDQVEAEARALSAALIAPENAELAATLRGITVTNDDDESPLATSTLRGEHEDNQAWSKDPSRPAIIAGTVDMIGSRLLFSGYGVSWKSRPIHAALLAQDTLIVIDEAHLSDPFVKLVEQIAEKSGKIRPLRYIKMSATQKPGEKEKHFPPTLDDDLQNPVFAERYNAVKKLELREAADTLKEIESLATTNPPASTAIFVRSPKIARKIAAKLPKESVVVITGQMRGHERTAILANTILQRLRNREAPGESPCYIVATSAAEAGMDFSVQRLITEIDSADHLIQRFGRLNRFGATEGHAIVVAAPKQRAANPILEATWNYLRTLAGNVSPSNLRALPPNRDSVEPTPSAPPLLPWLIDVWSMTSIRQRDWPDRPAVASWLRGAEEKSIPEIHIAWRDETADLADPLIPEKDVETVLDIFPVLVSESLKLPATGELFDELQQYAAEPAVLQLPDGGILRGKIETLLQYNRNSFSYATLILPPYIGTLDKYGMVDWTPVPAERNIANGRDVSCAHLPARAKIRLPAGSESEAPSNYRFRLKVPLPGSETDTPDHYWYFCPAPKKSFPAIKSPENLTLHQQAAESVAKQLAACLRLGDVHPLLPAILPWSAANHDTGKARRIWQNACGDAGTPNGPLAKSAKFNGRALNGFRHELASLIDAEPLLPADGSPADHQLALHLIAAHHGFARPHFPERAIDTENITKSLHQLQQTPLRFSQLHQQWGAWTLAYLETILRAADAIASRGLEDKTPE